MWSSFPSQNACISLLRTLENLASSIGRRKSTWRCFRGTERFAHRACTAIAMLLRSLSTPVLGSLLPPLHAHDSVSEEREPSFSVPDGARSLAMRRSASHCSVASLHASGFASSSSRSVSSPQFAPVVIGEEISASDEGLEEQGAVTNALLSSKMRRVQSENDLSKSSSMNPASMAAASSLLDEGTQKKGPWPKPGNGGGGLCRRGRQRSLNSISSLYCLGAHGLDREDCIPEEAETSSGGSVFESMGSEQGSFSRSKSSLVLEAKDGEVSVREREQPGRSVSSGFPTVNSAFGAEARQSGTGSYEEGLARASSTGRGHTNLVFQSFSRADAAASADEVLCGGGTVGGAGGGRPSIPVLGGRGGGGNEGGGYPEDSLDLHFQTMLKENPGHPLFLRNYAQYLAEGKREFAKAEEYYQRAILASPGDGELLAQFATILWDVHRDHERAASYFDRAVQAAPEDSYVMAAHASFLWSSEEEEDPTPSFSAFPCLVSAVQT